MAGLKTSAYLVLVPDHAYSGKVTGISVDRVTKSLPRLNSRSIALKLNIEIESQVFEQFLPEASLRITDSRAFLTPSVGIEEPSPEPETETEPNAN